MAATEPVWSIDPGTWVEAAPFRAHLRHLMDVTGRPWQLVAEAAGISLPDAHRLLYGRHGRPVRRISPQTASRLFWIDRHQVLRAALAAGDPVDRRSGRGAGVGTAAVPAA